MGSLFLSSLSQIPELFWFLPFSFLILTLPPLPPLFSFFLILVFTYTQLYQFFATPWTVVLQAPLSMGILQARTLEWVAMPSSRGSSQPRDRTQVSCIAD